MAHNDADRFAFNPTFTTTQHHHAALGFPHIVSHVFTNESTFKDANDDNEAFQSSVNSANAQRSYL